MCAPPAAIAVALVIPRTVTAGQTPHGDLSVMVPLPTCEPSGPAATAT